MMTTVASDAIRVETNRTLLCSTFLAPTATMDWGVFANRNFRKGDLIDIAGLTLPMPPNSVTVEQSILQDYVYGYWRIRFPNRSPQQQQQPIVEQWYSVLLGMDMFYNHHTTPNIEFQTFGREPQQQQQQQQQDLSMNVQGFVALRDIERGEELFSTYKHGNKKDGGQGWFSARGISMQTPSVDKTKLSTRQLEDYAKLYCSRITGTPITKMTWNDRIMTLWPQQPSQRFNWMHQQEAFWPDLHMDLGWGRAQANSFVSKNERIEISTALLLSYSKHELQDSALRPLVYTWDDLYPQHHQVLQSLRIQQQQQNPLQIQFQGPSTDWQPVDGFVTLEDLVLFPAAGYIGLVQRRQSYHDITDCNCRLVLHGNVNGDPNDSAPSLTHKISVTIELIATRDIADGETLLLDLPLYHHDNNSTEIRKISAAAYRALYQELQQTGQPYNHELIERRLSPLTESRSSTREEL